MTCEVVTASAVATPSNIERGIVVRDIRIKTNGYKITEKHKALIEKWENFIFEYLDVAFIEHFYSGDNLDMAFVKLTDEHYGYFSITENYIGFNGYTCTHEEFLFFEKSEENSKFDEVVL